MLKAFIELVGQTEQFKWIQATAIYFKVFEVASKRLNFFYCIISWRQYRHPVPAFNKSLYDRLPKVADVPRRING